MTQQISWPCIPEVAVEEAATAACCPRIFQGGVSLYPILGTKWQDPQGLTSVHYLEDLASSRLLST